MCTQRLTFPRDDYSLSGAFSSCCYRAAAAFNSFLCTLISMTNHLRSFPLLFLLSDDPESHCGRTQERVGSRTGAEAAQGRRSGPCPPQDLRMGSPLRVSPAGRGEVLGALPGAEAQLSQTSLAVWRPGGQRPPDINTRQITPRQVPLVWQTPD